MSDKYLFHSTKTQRALEFSKLFSTHPCPPTPSFSFLFLTHISGFIGVDEDSATLVVLMTYGSTMGFLNSSVTRRPEYDVRMSSMVLVAAKSSSQ